LHEWLVPVHAYLKLYNGGFWMIEMSMDVLLAAIIPFAGKRMLHRKCDGPFI
jgi:hypothetical protein